MFSVTDPVLQSYMFYSGLMALKVLLMSGLTGVTRMTRGVFANPEDAKLHPKGKVTLNDPTVERIRRAHLNDLENIPAFWLLGALYVTTNPAATWATLLFRLFAVSRIIHTVVYAIIPIRQPARAIAYLGGQAVNFYMGIQVLLHYVTAL